MVIRRQYSAEYKLEAVRLVQSGGQSAGCIARDPGINPSMLARWCRELTGGCSQSQCRRVRAKAILVMKSW